MHALGKLITDRMADAGLTYDAVAAAGDIPKGTVWALVNRELKAPPRITTLERLAKGLGLPLDVVEAKATEATGYHKQRVVSSDPNVSIIAAVAEQLSPRDRKALAAMAEAFLAEARRRSAK